MTEREQKVLRLRFGMNDGRARTLEEVGKEFDVTRERIRQIEAKSTPEAPSPQPQQKIKRLSGLRKRRLWNYQKDFMQLQVL